jgi:uncharacterized membrane protein
MFARALTLYQWIRTSLWALPLLMVLCAASAAFLVLNVRLNPGGDRKWWWLYSGDAGQAQGLLSSLLSAMITMGTLVISITMVVLTLAAQQLGPRLIQSFMADRRTQASIGLFIATIVYLLLVLRTIHGGSDGGIPNLAVSVGTGLVLFSVVTLPLFVHHLARAIVSDTVIWRVGNALDASANSLLPDETDPEQALGFVEAPEERAAIRLYHGGYIQAIDHGALVACAQAADAVIVLDYRAGHHVIAGAAVAWICPPVPDHDKIESAVNASILIGSERTPVQDIEYSVRQLGEVALRALSPGVNDPHTAVVAIDRLAQSLGLIMQRGSAPQVWRDEDGAVRVIGAGVTFEGILDEAFNQIRQAGSRQPAILIRLAENLAQLAEVASPEQKTALAVHLNLVVEAGRRTIESPRDLKAIEDAVKRGLAGCRPADDGDAASG